MIIACKTELAELVEPAKVELAKQNLQKPARVELAKQNLQKPARVELARVVEN